MTVVKLTRVPSASVDHGPCFVVFGQTTGPANVRWWWKPFRRPNYEHCIVLMPQEQGCVLVDGNRGGVLVNWSPPPAADCAAALLAQFPGWRALRIARHPDTVYFPFEPMTCVTAVKAVLGVRAPTVVSPYGLYLELLRRGAERFG